MPQKTPPKGRPTPGRRDRQVVRRQSRSRTNTKKFVWAVLALVILAAVLVIGSGTGGNGDLGTQSVLAGPLLLWSQCERDLGSRTLLRRILRGRWARS
jgi:hypothetical protein